MLHGDLANSVKDTIAFRCDDFLVKYKDSGVANKLLNVLFGKSTRAFVNEEVLSVIENIYRKSECTVDLIIDSGKYDSGMKQILDNVPFGRIIEINSPAQITMRLNTGDITYYVDDNAPRRSLVNSKYAYSFDDFKRLIYRALIKKK